jgi:hypothetical protein
VDVTLASPDGDAVVPAPTTEHPWPYVSAMQARFGAIAGKWAYDFSRCYTTGLDATDTVLGTLFDSYASQLQMPMIGMVRPLVLGKAREILRRCYDQYVASLASPSAESGASAASAAGGRPANDPFAGFSDAERADFQRTVAEDEARQRALPAQRPLSGAYLAGGRAPGKRRREAGDKPGAAEEADEGKQDRKEQTLVVGLGKSIASAINAIVPDSGVSAPGADGARLSLIFAPRVLSR